MIIARIKKGRVQVQDPIPKEWEGQMVKIMPLTPDDPLPDPEEWLAKMKALGPMEYDPGEKEKIEKDLAEMGRISKEAMKKMAGLDH
ncbi:MAG TPA: hypothetical protein VKS79_09835 [Gemmataceae bacterium]|nr:hypothetical protein [Gemmataceae bacterium]